jgi:hypothetical protein
MDSDFMVDLELVGAVKNNYFKLLEFDTFVTNPSVVLFDRFMMEEQFGWRVSKLS